MPAHHLLEHFLDAYLGALRQVEGEELDKASPLFRTLRGRGASSSRRRGWRGRTRDG
jgi:hypothetical protein